MYTTVEQLQVYTPISYILYHVGSSYDSEVAARRCILQGWGGAGNTKGQEGQRSQKGHIPHCLAQVGCRSLFLSSIGWRPTLMQRVSDENSGQTGERERTLFNHKHF